VRALERLADSRLDPIIVDCSFWRWAEREDSPPAGLMDAAQRDLDTVLDRLERALAPRGKPWPFGAPGLLECAWFANLIAVRPMGFAFDAARLPSVAKDSFFYLLGLDSGALHRGLGGSHAHVGRRQRRQRSAKLADRRAHCGKNVDCLQNRCLQTFESSKACEVAAFALANPSNLRHNKCLS
jgi:hypothetical protein